MYNWGKSYASYWVAADNKDSYYQPGMVFENIDALVNFKRGALKTKTQA